ncbi:putative Ig domain-containing protein [Spirosoma spitsbergense]|uniref:putative Ig domain-containing protein n=1 Tax=Spirosoma spitsbergense TaxID=431554 RepID=UPI00037FA72E|nr:putative Ig domain-containing protein [Spirosoma spitsbergense]
MPIDTNTVLDRKAVLVENPLTGVLDRYVLQYGQVVKEGDLIDVSQLIRYQPGYDEQGRSFAQLPNCGAPINPTPTSGHALSSSNFTGHFAYSVPAGNPPPTLSQQPPDVTLATYGQQSIALPEGTFADNSGDTHTITGYSVNHDTPLPSGVSVDVSTGEITIPASFANQSIRLGWKYTDSAGQSVYADFLFTEARPNRAPVLVTPTGSLSSDFGKPFSFPFPAAMFSDPDGDALTWSLLYATALAGPYGALPDWCSFDVLTRMFTGTSREKQPRYFRKQVTDGKADPVHDDFTFNTIADSIELIRRKFIYQPASGNDPGQQDEVYLIRMKLWQANDLTVPVLRTKNEAEANWRSPWGEMYPTQGVYSDYNEGLHYYFLANLGLVGQNPTRSIWQFKASIDAPDSELIEIRYTYPTSPDLGTQVYPVTT